MKFKTIAAFISFSAAIISFSTTMVAVATAAEPAAPIESVREVRASEFTPFGVTQNANLELLGCKSFDDDIFDCTNLPERNDFFSVYTVETRTSHRSGICAVRAYTSVYRGDHTGYQVKKSFDQLTYLMIKKYGVPTVDIADLGSQNTSYKSADLFAASLAAGAKEFVKEWKNIPGKLPNDTSIKMTMRAANEEKTYVELSYFFGGPGCGNDEDRALRGL